MTNSMHCKGMQTHKKNVFCELYLNVLEHFRVRLVWKMCPINHKLSKWTSFLMCSLDGQHQDVIQVYGIPNKKFLVFCIIHGRIRMFAVHSNHYYSSEATYQVIAALLFTANTIKSANVHYNEKSKSQKINSVV